MTESSDCRREGDYIVLFVSLLFQTNDAFQASRLIDLNQSVFEHVKIVRWDFDFDNILRHLKDSDRKLLVVF